MNILIAASAVATSVYTDLLNQAATFAGSVLLFALTALATKLFQRAGLKLSQDQETAFDAIIAKGISAAEEAAHKAIGGIKLTGDDKLGVALKFVLSQIDAQGLAKKGEDLIKDRIHSALGQTRKVDSLTAMAGQLMASYGSFLNKPTEPIATAAVVPPVVDPAAPTG